MTITAAMLDHQEYLKGRVLDVGCGSMAYKRLVFENITEWVGLDIRPVGDIQADMCEMPHVADESFDSVLCANSLQYALDPISAFGEFYRVLKPGGTVLLVAPNSCADDHVAFWGFRTEGVRLLLLQADFEIVSIRTASRQFVCEYENSKLSKYGFQVPEEIKGLVEHLDDTYPHIVVAVGVKE